MVKVKKETVKIDGEKITFKAGALRNMLKMTSKEKLTKTMMRKALKKKDGAEVTFFGRKRKMTKLLRKRLNFGLTLMK
jgi:hypothetical protein